MQTSKGHEADFVFATQRLVVETDSWQYHHTRQAFERDRALARAGYRTLRVTYRQLEDTPNQAAAAIAAALRPTARPDGAP
jgi:very-short-patch-repair endonuclease